jgi:hypothetical protein
MTFKGLFFFTRKSFSIIASHLPRNYGLKNQRAKDMNRRKKDDEEGGKEASQHQYCGPMTPSNQG